MVAAVLVQQRRLAVVVAARDVLPAVLAVPRDVRPDARLAVRPDVRLLQL
jgi:hypothetical protein